MRTTISLDEDVLAEVNRLRRQDGLGLSEAVNQLARRGVMSDPPRQPFVQRTVNLGLKVDVTNIGELLALLEEDEQR